MKKITDKGQVALFLVLIVTVVSALAVSLASRSTVDTKIQETESEGVQALIHAQTGIEQMIMSPEVQNVTDVNFEATRSNVASDRISIDSIEKGSMVEVNLTGADFSKLTGLRVSWSPNLENSNGKPAILVSVISNSNTIKDYAYDYDGVNGFTMASDGLSQDYAKVTPPAAISISSTTAKVRVTVLGSGARVGIFPTGSGAVFPTQSKLIRSTGLVSSTDKTVKYGLQYDESSADSAPSVFDYVLFSGGSIVQ